MRSRSVGFVSMWRAYVEEFCAMGIASLLYYPGRFIGYAVKGTVTAKCRSLAYATSIGMGVVIWLQV